VPRASAGRPLRPSARPEVRDESACDRRPEFLRAVSFMRTRALEFDDGPPNAPSLINFICVSGYDRGSEVGDIIDNGISACARVLWDKSV
jgi:hypothetical protein